MPKKLIIIGGGAAGFFCAINAKSLCPALEVVIVEKSSKLLAKVKISGGGRCNVSHQCDVVSEMIQKYPRGKNFVSKLFRQFFIPDTVKWFADRGVELKAEQDGRMFPVTDSSQTIINCFLSEAARLGVEVVTNKTVKSILRHPVGWELQVNEEKWFADAVCIACGGFPKPEMFQWITATTGHTVSPPVPSLFTFNIPGHSITSLMGISVENAIIKVVDNAEYSSTGPVLITHWGLSGPAVLRLSAFAARHLYDKNYRFEISVNWVGQYNENSLREFLIELKKMSTTKLVYSKNPFNLSARLWEYFLQQSEVIDKQLQWANISSKQLNKLIQQLCNGRFQVVGKTTFKEEFVTAGGINLTEIDVNTMESRLQPNLFFAGEIVDVDGITGGYNFQFAWSSGMVAAKAIADKFV